MNQRDRTGPSLLMVVSGLSVALALLLCGEYVLGAVTVVLTILASVRIARRWPITAMWILRWQLRHGVKILYVNETRKVYVIKTRGLPWTPDPYYREPKMTTRSAGGGRGPRS